MKNIWLIIMCVIIALSFTTAIKDLHADETQKIQEVIPNFGVKTFSYIGKEVTNINNRAIQEQNVKNKTNTFTIDVKKSFLESPTTYKVRIEDRKFIYTINNTEYEYQEAITENIYLMKNRETNTLVNIKLEKSVWDKDAGSFQIYDPNPSTLKQIVGNVLDFLTQGIFNISDKLGIEYSLGYTYTIGNVLGSILAYSIVNVFYNEEIGLSANVRATNNTDYFSLYGL